MEKQINITLGSTSQHKIEAVKQACQQLGLTAVVSGVKTTTGQNEQPIDLAETYQGALLRAQAAKSASGEAIAIGIESGIFLTRSEKLPLALDLAVIVVIAQDGRQIVTTTPGVVFPADCLAIAEQRGFATTTTGSVIAEKLGGDGTDPHSTLTNGKVSRSQTLVDGLAIALAQL